MSRIVFLALVILGAGLTAGAAHAVEPTIHEIYQTAESGKLAEAQAMLAQVLREHPDSAKAHFVEADLMARQGRLADARGELAEAEKLAPGLPFAKAQAVQALQTRLSSSSGFAQPNAPSRPVGRSGFLSWMLIGGIGLFAFLWLAVRRPLLQRNGLIPAGATGNGPLPPNAGSGVPSMSPTGGLGSGILGGLATGAALGAGMVAGEELVHRFLDGNSATTGISTHIPRPFGH